MLQKEVYTKSLNAVLLWEIG